MVIVEMIMLIMEIIGEHADDNDYNGDYGHDYSTKEIIAEYVDDTGDYGRMQRVG